MEEGRVTIPMIRAANRSARLSPERIQAILEARGISELEEILAHSELESDQQPARRRGADEV